jgi:hypothetical protein
VIFDANETLVVAANTAIDTAPISKVLVERIRSVVITSPRFKTDEIVPQSN